MKKVFTFSLMLLLSFATTVSYASKKNGAPLKSAQDDESPVLFSSEDESDEHWYYVNFKRSADDGLNQIWSAKEGLSVIYQLPLAATNQALQRWKFIGDETDFTIVNEATGWTVHYSNVKFTELDGETAVLESTYYLAAEDEYVIHFAFETNNRGNWILRDLTTGTYVNDRKKGSTNPIANVCGYGVKDDAGNDIAFLLYEKTILSGTTLVSLEAPNESVTKGSLTVSGIDLSEEITATISGYDDGDADVFTLSSSSIPATGGTVEVIFAPTEVKDYTATLTLSSDGAEPVTIDLKGHGFARSELPTISSEDNSDEHWYYIKVFRKAAANTAWSYVDSTQMIVQDTLRVGEIRDNQQWKIGGSWEDGFYFVNKAGGEITYNATATDTKYADRYYKADEVGDLFDFVRFSVDGVATLDWQLRNREVAKSDPAATKIYVNDDSGKHLLHYYINDSGNRLSFVPVGVPSISSVATVPFEIPKGDYAEYGLSVFGQNLDVDITVTLSGDEDNVFSVVDDVTSVSAEGGKLTIAFAPTADKLYTATLTLTSGETTQVVPITGNSDLNVPTISTDGNEAWYYIGFERKAGDNLVWTATPDEDTNERYDTRIKQTTLTEGNLDQQWKLVGTWVKGYQIINHNGGAFYFLYDPASGAGESSIARGLLIEEEALGDTVLFKRQNATAKWQWQMVGKNDGTDAHNYLNDFYGDEITVWTANNEGNPLIFTPVGGNSISTPAGDVDGAIVSVKYYNLMGREVLRPATTGVYIVRNIYASGKVKAIKQLFIVK
jgi:hypothetical protein